MCFMSLPILAVAFLPPEFGGKWGILMAVELAAVWVNPYTIEKSRTGGVIARLLSLCPGESELIAARMFAPGRELVEKYCRLISPKGAPESRKVRKHIQAYIREHWLAKDSLQDKPRVLALLFRGENAISVMRRQVVGPIARDSISGETVRDTYGDYIEDSQGRIRYFEPAVFIIPERSEAEKTMKLWARYSDSDGGILEEACRFASESKPEKTLVLMKPENFKGPSSMAGNIIDIISRTGLRIIGAKIIHLSIRQAEEFYRPVGELLPERMKPRLIEQLKESLNELLDFDIPPSVIEELADRLKGLKAGDEFNKIIRSMAGVDPRTVTSARKREKPGPEKCLALIYQGPEAISKIRNVLGATDPTKAEWATIRRIYGHGIDTNVAHASDSKQSAAREMEIIRMNKNDFKNIIYDFYKHKSATKAPRH